MTDDDRKHAFWILFATIFVSIALSAAGWTLLADLLFYPVLIAILILAAVNFRSMLRRWRGEE